MSKVVVILGFLVSFAAGLTVGWRVVAPLHASAGPGDRLQENPKTQPATRPGRDPRGGLTEVLKRTPQQQAEMKQIGEAPAQQARHEHDERRKALRKDRDEAMAKLLTE